MGQLGDHNSTSGFSCSICTFYHSSLESLDCSITNHIWGKAHTRSTVRQPVDHNSTSGFSCSKRTFYHSSLESLDCSTTNHTWGKAHTRNTVRQLVDHNSTSGFSCSICTCHHSSREPMDCSTANHIGKLCRGLHLVVLAEQIGLHSTNFRLLGC